MATQRATVGVLAAGVAVALGLTPAEADPEARRASLPDPIAGAFHATFPGGVIRTASPETEDGVTVYDIEFKDGDLDRECDIAADGTILNTSTAVDPASVPEAVTKSFITAADGGDVTRVERAEIRAATKHGKVVPLGVVKIEFEAELTKGAKDGEVTVSSDGTIVERTKWWKRGDKDSH